MMNDLPRKALSIRQPWAWLIVNGWKDIENRDWATNFRGPVLIHTGQKIERDVTCDLQAARHPVTGRPWARFEGAPIMGSGDDKGIYQVGGIVGVVEIVDCVTASSSPWFVGKYGFVLRRPRPLPFMPMKGQLGFFEAEYRP